MPSTRAGAINRAHHAFDSGAYLAALETLVAVPTESQNPDAHQHLVAYCTQTLPPMLHPLGFTTETCPNPRPNRGPILLAERIEDPARPTVLLYGHGDVVRGLKGRWSNNRDPFVLAPEDDRIYGRGTADNKGQHLIAIQALAATLAERGHLGFNTKLLIETGEEVGSPGLREFLARNRTRLAADVFVGLDGPRQALTTPELRLGARGGLTFDLVVRLRDGEHHSGHWGGVLTDPAFILAHALASMLSRDGRILVQGWTPETVPDSVRTACRSLVFDDIPGLPTPEPGWGEPGLSKAERIYAWSSLVLLAQRTGHPDSPTNAVQPEARATLQLRHTVDVPKQNLLPALRDHLDARGFPDVRIEPGPDREPFDAARTDPAHPWVRKLAASMQLTAGQPPNIVPNSSGGNPSCMFAEELGLPVIWVPNSYAGCGQHGPDEHALAPLLREGLALMAGIWWDIGEPGP